MKKTAGISHIWSVLCSSSSIDRDTNSLSVLNVIDELTLPAEAFEKFPMSEKQDGRLVPLRHEVLTIWTKNAQFQAKEVSRKVRLKLVGPTGKILGVFPYDLFIPSDKLRMRVRMSFSNFKISPDGGLHEIRVELCENGSKFSHVGTIFIHVNIEIKKQNS